MSVYSLFLTPDPGLRHRRTPNTAPPPPCPQHAGAGRPRARRKGGRGFRAQRPGGKGKEPGGSGAMERCGTGTGTGTGTPQALPPPFADSAPVSLFCRSGFGELLSPRDAEVARPGRRQGSQKRVPGILLLWRLCQPLNRCRAPAASVASSVSGRVFKRRATSLLLKVMIKITPCLIAIQSE